MSVLAISVVLYTTNLHHMEYDNNNHGKARIYLLSSRPPKCTTLQLSYRPVLEEADQLFHLRTREEAIIRLHDDFNHPGIAIVDAGSCDWFLSISAHEFKHKEIVIGVSAGDITNSVVLSGASELLNLPVSKSSWRCIVKKLSRERSKEENQSEADSPEDNGPMTFNGKLIAFPRTKGLRFAIMDDIIHVEGQGTVSVVTLTGNERFVSCRSIGPLSHILLSLAFIRAHRSHIVNPRHMVSASVNAPYYLKMSNGDKIPLSKSGRLRVLQNMKLKAVASNDGETL